MAGLAEKMDQAVKTIAKMDRGVKILLDIAGLGNGSSRSQVFA